MARVATSLARGGRAGIVELCRARLDATRFRRELRARLSRLVGFEAYCVNTVDPEAGVITSSIGDGLSQDAAQHLFALEEECRDVNMLAALPGPVTMHAATGGDVAQSERMRDIFLPLGLHDELRAPLRIGGACWGYLHLFRSGAPFTRADVERVAAIERDIAGALRDAHFVETRGAPMPADIGVVVFDRNGDVRTSGEEARAWMSGDVGGALPHALRVAAARRRLVAHHRTTSGAWVSIHAAPLGDDVAVVLAPSRPRAAILFRAHALTPREREVAGLLAAGHSNASLAAELAIGLHTAKDHVKAIFAKTRTSDRAEFARRFS